MSISSVITGGFGTPGSAFLVITDGFATAGAVPPVVVTQTGGGGSKRKAKRPKRIRYSDFESREAFEKAFRAGIVAPMSEPPPPIRIEEDDDDDAVVANLLMLLH